MVEYTAYEERAAILEFDANLERQDAENLAKKYIIKESLDKWQSKNKQIKGVNND